MLASVGVLLVDRSEKRRALRHMAGRDPLSASQFANRFFSGEQIPAAEKLVEIFSRHLSVDLSRLHPDDRLAADLRMDALDSLSTVEFVLDIEKELKIRIPDETVEKMFNFRQVVEFVSAQCRAEQGAAGDARKNARLRPAGASVSRQNQIPMRRKVAVALAGTSGAVGYWLGEGVGAGLDVVPLAIGLGASLAVGFTFPGKSWLRIFGGVVALVLYAVAFYAGSLSFSRAFNECVARGEEVRARLNEYEKKHGQYPERISQLEVAAPCSRIVRASILEYEKKNDAYVLSFKDWLVEHKATESESFMAQK